jgi:epoxyqueuosine reductase
MQELKEKLIQLAQNEGFSLIQFASPEAIQQPKLQNRLSKLGQWLDQKNHGTMTWLEKHRILRENPLNVFPAFKSMMICAAFLKNNQRNQDSEPKIARYARKLDYHIAIRNSLKRILSKIKLNYPQIQGKAIVDTSPMDEKGWAMVAGIGFIGKNTLVIHPKFGSFFHLGELLLNVEITPDEKSPGSCGKCTLCIDSCPTQALSPYTLNANLCLSYQTIEKKENSEQLLHSYAGKNKRENYHGWVFGCDVCQEVCPYNQIKLNIGKVSGNSNGQDLEAELYKSWHAKALPDFSWDFLQQITETDFRKIFEKTAVARIGYDKFKLNLKRAAP